MLFGVDEFDDECRGEGVVVCKKIELFDIRWFCGWVVMVWGVFNFWWEVVFCEI